MKNFYYLQIEASGDKKQLVDKILEIKHNTLGLQWQHLFIEGEALFDYIDFFLGLLEGKYNALSEIGISRDMISIWHIYNYDGQCNFEYSPRELKRIGDNGIVLHVACWSTGEQPSFVHKVLN